MMAQQTQFLTLEEAAKNLGKSVSSIRKYISEGHLKKYRKLLDARVYVSAAEVEELKRLTPRLVDEGGE